jgi:hypothetical protein
VTTRQHFARYTSDDGERSDDFAAALTEAVELFAEDKRRHKLFEAMRAGWTNNRGHMQRTAVRIADMQKFMDSMTRRGHMPKETYAYEPERPKRAR